MRTMSVAAIVVAGFVIAGAQRLIPGCGQAPAPATASTPRATPPSSTSCSSRSRTGGGGAPTTSSGPPTS